MNATLVLKLLKKIYKGSLILTVFQDLINKIKNPK